MYKFEERDNMANPISVRLDDVHAVLLDKMVEKLGTNKSDVIQKALYSFAREVVLDPETVMKVIDEHYSGIYKDLDL